MFKTTIEGTHIRVVKLPRLLAVPLEWATSLLIGVPAAAIMVGHTLLAVQKDPLPAIYMWHEAAHARQAERYEPKWLPVGRRLVGMLIFWGKYAAEHFRNGYSRNKYELEAQRAVGRYLQGQAAQWGCTSGGAK